MPVADYSRRFPALADDLRVQFEVDQALTVEDGRRPELGHDRVRPDDPDGPDEALPALEGCDLLGELGTGRDGHRLPRLAARARRPVAVKVLSDDVPAARVRTEAEAASRLIHPNIVQVFEVKQHGDRTALVLEYVEGGNLAQKLAGKPQTAARQRPARRDAGLGDGLRPLRGASSTATSSRATSCSPARPDAGPEPDRAEDQRLRPGQAPRRRRAGPDAHHATSSARRATWPPSRPASPPGRSARAADVYCARGDPLRVPDRPAAVPRPERPRHARPGAPQRAGRRRRASSRGSRATWKSSA